MARLLTKSGVATVDPNLDGLLSQAADAAVCDVRELRKMSVYLNQIGHTLIPRTFATLDLATKTTRCNTVIESAVEGSSGNAITIAFTPGDTLNAGHLDESGFPAIVFHYKTAVTTVANFETAIAASAHLAVLTPGTGANVLATPADTFTATNLAGGTETQGTFSIAVEKTIDGTNFALHSTVTQASFTEGVGKAFEVVLNDANGMPISAEQVRTRLTATEGGDTFTMSVVGELREAQ